MRSRITFISILVSLGIIRVLAQDVDFESDSEDGELLHIENTGESDKTAVSVISPLNYSMGIDVTAGQTGISAYCPSTNNYWVRGIYSEASNAGSGDVFGVETYAGGGGMNAGLMSHATSGGYGTFAYGLNATAGGGEGSNNYGVYATASGGEGSANYAGWFDGNVVVMGDCDPCSPSDEMFKKNIQSLDGGLGKIMALKPKSYEMKIDEFKDKIFLAHGTQFGLIAQDVQSVLPELVHSISAPARLSREDRKRGQKEHALRGDPLKFKAVNYTGLIPVLIEAIQEQQSQIQDQKNQIETMRMELATLKAGR